MRSSIVKIYLIFIGICFILVPFILFAIPSPEEDEEVAITVSASTLQPSAAKNENNERAIFFVNEDETFGFDFRGKAMSYLYLNKEPVKWMKGLQPTTIEIFEGGKTGKNFEIDVHLPLPPGVERKTYQIAAGIMKIRWEKEKPLSGYSENE